MTVHDCVDRAARLLTDAGFPLDEARRDAAVLARSVLGWTTAQWASLLRDDAPDNLMERLEPLATRRSRHEPVAYITGTREFFGRPFQVTPSVLIPRPETEGIIDEALAVLRARDAVSNPLIVDVGTGSGCIAITLALEWPGARIIATDISAETLNVAKANAAALGAPVVEFSLVGSGQFLPPSIGGADLIVSNPPYVAERDRASLSRDVRDFEPAAALFAGDDGLAVIRTLVPEAAKRLATGAALIVEIGAGQADAVSEIVGGSGLILQAIRPDLQAIPRIVVARRVA